MYRLVVGISGHRVLHLLVFLFLKLLQLGLVLSVPLLKALDLLLLVQTSLFVLLESGLQFGILVLPHSQVLHQAFDLVLELLPIRHLVQVLALLHVLVLQLLDGLLELPPLVLGLLELLLQLLDVVTGL